MIILYSFRAENITKKRKNMKIMQFTVGASRTNCYFAVDEKTGKTLVIDPGGDFELLKGAVESNSLRVDKILLTHIHFDHIQALPELRAYTGAPVMIHEGDAPDLHNGERNLSLYFTGGEIDYGPADIILRDGDGFTVGETEFKVLHTPGHTLGGICVISGDTIFSGDTLFYMTVGRTDLYDGSQTELLKSLSRLKTLREQCGHGFTVLSGHGRPTTLDHEIENNEFFKQI